MKTRRDALKTMAAATALPALPAQHQHAAPLAQIAQLAAPKFFKPTEIRTLASLVDTVIPRSETPGASDAGVHLSMDHAVHGSKTLQERFRKGLAWVDKESKRKHKKPFTDLGAEEREAILLAAPKDFFRTVKDMTVDFYYNSKEGLQEELGWNANTFLAEFPGCTHPEHQG